MINSLSHKIGLEKIFFKFIVKSESPHLKVLKTYFKSTNAIISEKKSSKKSFTSLSVKVEMKTPEDVIKIYKKSSKLRRCNCSLILKNL